MHFQIRKPFGRLTTWMCTALAVGTLGSCSARNAKQPNIQVSPQPKTSIPTMDLNYLAHEKLQTLCLGLKGKVVRAEFNSKESVSKVSCEVTNSTKGTQTLNFTMSLGKESETPQRSKSQTDMSKCPPVIAPGKTWDKDCN